MRDDQQNDRRYRPKPAEMARAFAVATALVFAFALVGAPGSGCARRTQQGIEPAVVSGMPASAAPSCTLLAGPGSAGTRLTVDAAPRSPVAAVMVAAALLLPPQQAEARIAAPEPPSPPARAAMRQVLRI